MHGGVKSSTVDSFCHNDGAVVVRPPPAVASYQGAPFEVSKRRWVMPLLHVSTVPLAAQLGFTILGIELVTHHKPPDCWAPDVQPTALRVAEAAAWSTFSFLVVALIGILVTYNLYDQHRTDLQFMRQMWQQRCACIAGLLCCRAQVFHQTEGKRPPIHNVRPATPIIINTCACS